MKGKIEFTKEESAMIKELLNKKNNSDKKKQKVVRAKIRKLEFYISDFRKTRGAFKVEDFDELIKKKRVKII